MKQTVKRRISLSVALLVMILILTGTYAWQSFGQRAFNVAWEDAETNYGGRIRDDYDGVGSGDHNKDVYAENFGDNPIFVRIRLREFLAINGEPVIAGMSLDDVTTWPIYLSQPNDVHTPLTGSQIATLHGDLDDDGFGIGWTLGHRQPKFFMPTHNQATYQADIVDPAVPNLFAHNDAFRMTEATGRGVDAIANEERYVAFDPTDVEHAQDFWVNGLQTGPGDGTHNYWSAGDAFEAYLIYTALNEDTDSIELRNAGLVTHVAQPTLEPYIGLDEDGDAVLDSLVESVLNLDDRADFVGVMTMNNWIALGRPAGNFWILDVDGWFYWNGWLPAGEATSLLLDAIYLPSRGTDGWEHVIEVEGDFFTEASINELDMTTNAFGIFGRLFDEEDDE